MQCRYPQDVYDRLWSGYQCDMLGYNNSRLVSTNAASTESNDDDPYNLPQSLLQTACRARNSTSPLEYTWTPDETWSRFYFCFHFAEIEKLEAGQFREMRIVLNDVHTITESVKLLQYLRPHTFCSKGYVVIPNQLNKLSIYATSQSSLPPILNGLEVFCTTENPNPLTFSQDGTFSSSYALYIINNIRCYLRFSILRINREFFFFSLSQRESEKTLPSPWGWTGRDLFFRRKDSGIKSRLRRFFREKLMQGSLGLWLVAWVRDCFWGPWFVL